MAKKDGGAAFPQYLGTDPALIVDVTSGKVELMGSGMSLRQWYAGLAMQQLLAVGRLPFSSAQLKSIAKTAFQAADAMVEASDGE